MAIKGNKSHGEDTRNQVEQVFQALLDHQDKTGSLRNILVRDLWQTVNTKEKKEAVKKEEIKRAFGDLVTLKILIDERGSKRQGAHLWHFDLKLECAHDREASLKEFRQRWEKQWGAGKAPAQKRAEKPQRPTNARTIDYGPYLRSLIKERSYREPELDFELMAQLLPIKQDPEETQEKTEPLPVLSAMEQYAAEHVLLIGRPGAGKSTALRRLLIGKAKLALEDTSAQIPVLVELRYLDAQQPSFLRRIQDFLRGHDLHLEEATLIQELQAGRFLLLIDGVNELPSEAAHQKVIAFRKDYSKAAMVFSTRDITLNGDLGIHNKLEMQPLSKLQMEQFVKAYLPEQGDAMLRQLEGKLKQVSKTPLFLWMLYEVFRLRGEVPSSVGELFQRFTTDYEQIKRREGAFVSEDFWLWHTDLLTELAWQMTKIKGLDKLTLTISRADAEAVLKNFLKSEVEYPTQRAKKWLQELLQYHLIQRTSRSLIEFHHQLFQEYYAAKALGQRLSFLSDEELKRDYLNHLKWTEPFGLLLAVIEDNSQALRVVKLALNEVDFMLGAKLSGKVKPELQETTLSWIEHLNVPLGWKLECLETSQSRYAIFRLIQALEHPFIKVRQKAASALGNLESSEAIPALVNALQDSDDEVRQKAAWALGQLGSSEVISALIHALQNSDNEVRWTAAWALGQLEDSEAIPALVNALQDSDDEVRWAAATALGNLGDLKAIPALVNALQDPNAGVRQGAAWALGHLGSSEAIPALVNALQDSDNEVRWAAATALEKLRDSEAIPDFVSTLQDFNYDVQQTSASALSPDAIPGLVNALQDSNIGVRREAASALRKLRSPEATPAFINALQDSDDEVRREAASALRELGSPEAIPALVNALQDSDIWVRWSAATALGNLGSPEAIPALVNALQDSDDGMRRAAASALGNLGSLKAVPALINAFQNSNDWGGYFLWAIADIQGRYGFYNYDLMQKAQNLDSDRAS